MVDVQDLVSARQGRPRDGMVGWCPVAEARAALEVYHVGLGVFQGIFLVGREDGRLMLHHTPGVELDGRRRGVLIVEGHLEEEGCNFELAGKKMVLAAEQLG